LIFACFAMILTTDVYAGGTATATIEPSVFNITYAPGRALQGNTEFTPSVWHQDNRSGPFSTCEKHGRVNVRESKPIYPYRLLTDAEHAVLQSKCINQIREKYEIRSSDSCRIHGNNNLQHKHIRTE
jgi:hypothetical protein